MKRKIIDENQSYTFSDYFKMQIRTEDLLNYFGYSKENVRMSLSKGNFDLRSFEYLNALIEEHLIHISMENEITRREFLMAPVMSFVRHNTQAKLNSEYWVEINYQLKGSLDYFLKKESELLVVEAKNADLTRAFTQLAAELVALDLADETENDIIFGAVSTGQDWQFGKLIRSEKKFYQDIITYTVPTNLEEIIRILVGILEKNEN